MKKSEKKSIVFILMFYFLDDGSRARIAEDARDFEAAGLAAKPQEDWEN